MNDDKVQIRIDPAMFPFMESLAPGVIGYTVEHEGELWVPVIHAEREGAGDVGRYLDSLTRETRRVVVPNVISSRLAGMLARRGFTTCVEETEEVGPVECWERRAER